MTDDLQQQIADAGIDTSSFRVETPRDSEQIVLITVPGVDAIGTWERLRDLVPETGWWPVLLGTDDQIARHYEMWDTADDGPSAAEFIEMASTIDGGELLHARLHEFLFDSMEHEIAHVLPLDDDDHGVEDDESNAIVLDTAEMLTRWPAVPQGLPDQRIVSIEMGGDFPPAVSIALVPTPHSWEAPAYLYFGNWNDCPAPEQQVAIFRYWHDRWGTDIVAIFDDTLEAWAARLPATREEALDLAREQLAYAVDTFVGATDAAEGVVENAATLMVSSNWYFWWD